MQKRNHGTINVSIKPVNCKSISNEFQIKFQKCFFSLPIALDKIYIREKNLTESRNAVIDLSNNVRTEYINMINDSNWMSHATKNEIIEKIKSMNFIIAVSDANSNHSTSIDGYYDGLDLSENDFFENILRVLEFEQVIIFQKRFQLDPEHHLRIFSSTTILYPEYIAADNSICKFITFVRHLHIHKYMFLVQISKPECYGGHTLSLIVQHI